MLLVFLTRGFQFACGLCLLPILWPVTRPLALRWAASWEVSPVRWSSVASWRHRGKVAFTISARGMTSIYRNAQEPAVSSSCKWIWRYENRTITQQGCLWLCHDKFDLYTSYYIKSFYWRTIGFMIWLSYVEFAGCRLQPHQEMDATCMEPPRFTKAHVHTASPCGVPKLQWAWQSFETGK